MGTHSAKTTANFDRLRIATSCPISWEQMTGDIVDVIQLVDTPPPGTTIISGDLIRRLPIQ